MTGNIDKGAGHGRVEDERLLRGRGRFIEDAAAENPAYATFVRSPHAYARILAVETAEAARAPGVLAVLTAADMEAAGIKSISRHPPMTGRGGAKIVQTDRPALARDRVLHVGQPVAAIIAETRDQALDAAELVVVEYETLQPVIDVREAIEPGAPQLWADAAGNLALDWPGPAKDNDAELRAVEEAMAKAAHVARVTEVNQRIMVATMEPRGASASYDAANDRYTLRACSQGVGPLRDGLLPAMNLKREQ